MIAMRQYTLTEAPAKTLNLPQASAVNVQSGTSGVNLGSGVLLESGFACTCIGLVLTASAV